MSATESRITYSVEDINGSVRMTSVLLRSLNALRVFIKDIQEVARKPTMANIFWTLINLSRMYNSLKRIDRMLNNEVGHSRQIMKMLGGVGYTSPKDVPLFQASSDPFGFGSLSFTASAFRENLRMDLERIDISNLPEDTTTLLQRIVEDDAEMTAVDARNILRSRIIYPERSTGFLESSIGWVPESNGARITADAPYAWWVEDGHQTFMGHHYLRDAMEMSRQRLPLRIKAELNELINKSLS